MKLTSTSARTSSFLAVVATVAFGGLLLAGYWSPGVRTAAADSTAPRSDLANRPPDPLPDSNTEETVDGPSDASQVGLERVAAAEPRASGAPGSADEADSPDPTESSDGSPGVEGISTDQLQCLAEQDARERLVGRTAPFRMWKAGQPYLSSDVQRERMTELFTDATLAHTPWDLNGRARLGLQLHLGGSRKTPKLHVRGMTVAGTDMHTTDVRRVLHGGTLVPPKAEPAAIRLSEGSGGTPTPAP